MLKEGWDVTNLYTIIPLRTAASQTLREQTIGRGCACPTGKRTGNDKVDKLTIVAHDRFQEIIEAANRPDSIIRKENIITIDVEELGQPKEIIVAVSRIEKQFAEEQEEIAAIGPPEEKQKAQVTLDAKKALFSILPELNVGISGIQDLKKDEIKQIAVEKLKAQIYSTPQQILFAEEIIEEARNAYEQAVEEFADRTIEIPRTTIQQCGDVQSGFHDFDLDTKNLNYQPVSEEILVKKLREQEDSLDIVIGKGRIVIDEPNRIIVNELINYPEVDYDEQTDLLRKLAAQAVEKFKTYLDDNQLMNVVPVAQAGDRPIHLRPVDAAFPLRSPRL